MDIITVSQGAARQHASVVERTAPDDGWWNRALAFPIGGDGLCSPRDCGFDSHGVGGGEPLSGLEVA